MRVEFQHSWNYSRGLHNEYQLFYRFCSVQRAFLQTHLVEPWKSFISCKMWMSIYWLSNLVLTMKFPGEPMTQNGPTELKMNVSICRFLEINDVCIYFRSYMNINVLVLLRGIHMCTSGSNLDWNTFKYESLIKKLNSETTDNCYSVFKVFKEYLSHFLFKCAFRRMIR